MEGAVALDPAGIQRGDLGGMQSPTTTSSSFPRFHAPIKEARHCYSNQPGWGLEWKVMERTRGLQPEARSFRPPARQAGSAVGGRSQLCLSRPHSSGADGRLSVLPARNWTDALLLPSGK